MLIIWVCINKCILKYLYIYVYRYKNTPIFGQLTTIPHHACTSWRGERDMELDLGHGVE